MAFDEFLAERIQRYFDDRGLEVETMNMMGGSAFMLDGKMCVGIVKDELMARVGPDNYAKCLQRPGCREMNFTGRPMKGFVFVTPEGMDTDDDLAFYIDLAVDFNPQAKSSKRRRS